MAGEPIDSIAPVPPVTAVPPVPPVRAVPPIDAVPAPVLTPTRRVAAGPPSPARKPRLPSPSRTGTAVSSMVINLTSGRIALLSPDGAPVTGDVSTDLAVGSYGVSVDFKRRQWVFDPGQVQKGSRFQVVLDGTDPFDLSYAPALVLSVTTGFTKRGSHSLESVQEQLRADVRDGLYSVALVTLDGLNDIDLYDLIGQVWADEPEVVSDLQLHLEKAAAGESLNLFRLLRALEWVAVPREQLLIDSFKRAYVEPRSFAKNEERAKQGLTNVQLRFEYWLTPERAIVVYADDILDTPAVGAPGEHYGPGCLLYPPSSTRGRTPRMWKAKQDLLAEMAKGEFEFTLTAANASMHVINFTFMGVSLMAQTIPSLGAPRTSPRPISAAYQRQPGRWLRDFEAGMNMNEVDAAFEARVCNKDVGMGYYVNGVQFDGYDVATGALIDAKNYTAIRGTTRALLRNNAVVGTRILEQAERQVLAAGDRPVVWKVASAEATGKLRELFKTNKVPIQVLHVP